jgi:hypothetical protein
MIICIISSHNFFMFVPWHFKSIMKYIEMEQIRIIIPGNDVCGDIL